MTHVLSKLIDLPFKIFLAVPEFIVWELFSNGSWRQKKYETLQPARLLQDEVGYLRNQMWKMQNQHRIEIVEIERRNQEKLKLQASQAIIK